MVCLFCHPQGRTSVPYPPFVFSGMSLCFATAVFLRGREKDELTKAYKSYADYAFPNNETRHPSFKNAADSVICTPTNDECQFSNWKFVLRKCTDCTYIAIPGVEIDSSKLVPMITFNTYMTQFTCSHHGILIRETFTTYLDAKVK